MQDSIGVSNNVENEEMSYLSPVEPKDTNYWFRISLQTNCLHETTKSIWQAIQECFLKVKRKKAYAYQSSANICYLFYALHSLPLVRGFHKKRGLVLITKSIIQLENW